MAIMSLASFLCSCVVGVQVPVFFFFFAVMVIASCDGMYGDGSSMYGALFCGSKK